MGVMTSFSCLLCPFDISPLFGLVWFGLIFSKFCLGLVVCLSVSVTTGYSWIILYIPFPSYRFNHFSKEFLLSKKSRSGCRVPLLLFECGASKCLEGGGNIYVCILTRMYNLSVDNSRCIHLYHSNLHRYLSRILHAPPIHHPFTYLVNSSIHG